MLSEKSFSAMQAYNDSKLANVLFTVELAKRLNGTGVTCVSLHPGMVDTEIFRSRDNQSCGTSCITSIIRCFSCCFKSPENGAATSIYCAVDDSIPEKNGLYFE